MITVSVSVGVCVCAYEEEDYRVELHPDIAHTHTKRAHTLTHRKDAYIWRRSSAEVETCKNKETSTDMKTHFSVCVFSGSEMHTEDAESLSPSSSGQSSIHQPSTSLPCTIFL